MNQTHRGRFTAVIEFDMPIIPPTRHDLRAFIKEALESAGGCRHPDDLFFHSLGHVVVRHIHEVKKP
jgi:hypothetical protein